MKWLSRLFAVYLLLLTVFPCGDKGECQSITSILSAPADHSNHEDHEECPPLCTCVCCGHHIVKTVTNLQLTLPEIKREKKQAELQFHWKEIYHPIWQPPQLS